MNSVVELVLDLIADQIEKRNVVGSGFLPDASDFILDPPFGPWGRIIDQVEMGSGVAGLLHHRSKMYFERLQLARNASTLQSACSPPDVRRTRTEVGDRLTG